MTSNRLPNYLRIMGENEIPEQLGLKGKHSSKRGKNNVEKTLQEAQSCGMFKSHIVPKIIVSRY
jgi:hypothetical protein